MAPSNPEKPVATAHVHTVPAELASSRLASTPADAPANKPLDSKEANPGPFRGADTAGADKPHGDQH